MSQEQMSQNKSFLGRKSCGHIFLGWGKCSNLKEIDTKVKHQFSFVKALDF